MRATSSRPRSWCFGPGSSARWSIPATPNEMLQSLDETLAQINQMTEMVENLLTLARADEGRAPLAVEVADLRDIVADVAETAGMLGEDVGDRRALGDAGGAGAPRGGPSPDPRDAAQPGDQRHQVHPAKGGTVELRLWEDERDVHLRRVRYRASASPPATCRTSSSGSGGPTRPARAPATGPAPGWGWPSPSGSPRRMADPSRCRAGPGRGTIFTVRLPKAGGHPPVGRAGDPATGVLTGSGFERRSPPSERSARG